MTTSTPTLAAVPQPPSINLARSEAPSGRKVAVLGGGLAGIATAVRLAENGCCVTLIEPRTRLGGRATSHIDPSSGELMDNCQHVVMGCCTNIIDLYRRLGVADQIEWHDTLYFRDRAGQEDIVRGASLPAPFHLLRSGHAMRALRFGDKLAIGRALTHAMMARATTRDAWSTLPFSTWLAEQRQPATAVERFWDVVTISALNARSSDVSAASALHVFLEGFLAHRDGYKVGIPRVPLFSLYDAVRVIVERSGGSVQLGIGARELTVDEQRNRITSVTTDDSESLIAEAYVSAMPPYRLAALARTAPALRDTRLSRLDDFTHSPTIGVHMVFDRKILDRPHLAIIGSRVQWLFDATPNSSTASQHLRAVLSAADETVGLSSDEIASLTHTEITAFVPAAKEARMTEVRVIKERRATFVPRPGIDAIRPATTGACDNLFLAGDFCQTGWPATMEGAVRSGYLAASAILGQDCLIPGLSTRSAFRTTGASRKSEVLA